MITLGVDEVGRGSWAGPVVAGAVALARPIRGLKDSKQLSREQRTVMADIIAQKAAACSLGWASQREVDQFGLTQAVMLAMQRAVAGINLKYEQVIIDGNYNFLSNNPFAKTIIKADMFVPAVQAASIIAKVARDAYMQQQAVHYPGYGFERHVGYGTVLHRTALDVLGVCDLHRKSIRSLAGLL